MTKFLDSTGLSYLWDKIKALLSTKADKVSNATADNFAGLDSTGNLTDSGYGPYSFLSSTTDIPEPADTAPLMDGTSTVGTSTDYAREDHIHPSDSNKQNKLIAGRNIDIQDDIIEVEYLESTGTQYIDTGINYSNGAVNIDIRMNIQPNNITSNASFAGFGSSQGQWFGQVTSNQVYGCGSTASNSNVSTSNIVLANLLFGNGITLSLDGNLVGSRGSGTSARSFWIFKTSNSQSTSVPSRVYYMRMKNGDNNIVMHLIPVRRGTTGYMYDRVSGQLFGNDGTGDFIVGPDVRPIPSLISFVNDDGFITSADLPTKTSDLDNDGSDGTSTYVEADELATVATTGNYSDLNGTPTIPTVNNATLTIKQGGTTKGTFTSNASQDVEINLDAGGGGGSAGTLDTTNTTALTPSASESLGGSVSLHKVSKTGTYSDLIGKPTYALGESVGGPAASTVSIPYGTIDGTSTSTDMTATVSGITALRDGITCVIVNNVVTSESGVTLNVNNLGAKPIYCFYDDTTRAAEFFTVGKTCMFVYDSTKVSGGCWNLMYPFDSSISASTYLIRTYYSTLPLATALGRYRLLFISADGTKFVPANSSTSTSSTSEKTVTTEKIDPFGKIVYYNTTTTRTAGQTVSTSYQYLQNRLTLGYSFNRTGVALTLTTNTPVYVKCSPQTDGSVMIDGTTPFVQALPNTEDGYVYIYLGIATSATQIELMMNHPVYQYKGGKIVQYLPNDSNLVHKTGAETIVGIKTFNDDVNIVDSSLVIDTNDQNKHNVYINLDNYHDDGGDGIAVLALDDPSGEGNVIIRSVASPILNNDAANKQYVDESKRQAVSLNGRSGAYGLHQQSLVVCAESVSGMTWLMEPLTTSGGTGTKAVNESAKFPIGSKIYYHPDGTAFNANADFTAKTFYSSCDSVDARYSANNGSSLSLGSSSTSNVYLRVVASVSSSSWSVYSKGNIIVTSGNLVAESFYIYLGKTVGSTGYTFQLEDNNPLYYYDGTKLIDWAVYAADLLTRKPPYKKFELNTLEVTSSTQNESPAFASTDNIEAGTYKVTLMRHITYDGSTLSGSSYGLNMVLSFKRDGSNLWTYIAGGTYVMNLITSPNDNQNRLGSVVVFLTGFLTLDTPTQTNDRINVAYDGPAGVVLGADQPIFGPNMECVENKDFVLFEKI